MKVEVILPVAMFIPLVALGTFLTRSLLASGQEQSDYEKCFLEQGSCLLSEMTDVTEVYPGGDTRCYLESLDGSSNPYFFEVIPGRDADANKLHIHFQGGGLCVEPTTDCLSLRQPVPVEEGIFDRNNNENPYKDWTHVVLLYCSGDMHVGDVDYEDVSYKGRINTKVALQWAYDNLPTPDRVVVTGCSAGSMGLQYWSNTILQHYSALASPPRVSVVFDGFIGANPSLLGGEGLVVTNFDLCSGWEDLGWTADERDRCLQGDFSNQDAQLSAQQSNRDSPFGFISFKNDLLQRENGDSNQKSAYARQKSFLLSYTMPTSEQNHVVTYWMNGIGHCSLDSGRFYKRDSGRGEPSLVEWMEVMATWTEGTVISSSCSTRITPLRFWVDFGCDPTLSEATFTGQ